MFVAIIPLGLLIALHAIGLILFIGWMIGPIFGPKPPQSLGYDYGGHRKREAEELVRRNEAYAAYVAKTPWWKRVLP